MNEEYLWNREGRDPELEQLESLLGEFRYRPPAPRRTPASWVLLAAASVLFAAFGIGWYWHSQHQPGLAYQFSDGRQATLSAAQPLRTGPQESARLDVPGMGTVDIEPNSTVEFVPRSDFEHAFLLRQGTLRAVITAEPARFAIRTPASLAVDMGCIYSVKVDGPEERIHVTAGWVVAAGAGKESFIPSGAEVVTHGKLGPSAPYYLDSSAKFQSAVRELNLRFSPELLRTILAEATEQDAMTLWHLLRRVPPQSRGVVLDALLPKMREVKADIPAVRAGNSAAINQLWIDLNWGNADWFSTWQQLAPRVVR